MTERPTDLSNFPSYRQPRRSLFSARKFALMASVVAGLGVAVYGFGPSHGPVDICHQRGARAGQQRSPQGRSSRSALPTSSSA